VVIKRFTKPATRHSSMFANLMSCLVAEDDGANEVFEQVIPCGDKAFIEFAGNRYDGYGFTLLTRALSARSFVCAKTLLKKGVNPNTVDGSGRAPVDLVRGYPGMLIELVRHGLEVGPDLFEATFSYLDDDAAKCIIKYAVGFNPNKPFADGNTPLIHSVCRRLAGTVKVLIGLGARVNAKDEKDRTAAHIAAYKYKECGKPYDEIMSMLIVAHADMLCVDVYGNTPGAVIQKAVLGQVFIV
jgi:hypothetical protein